MNTVHSSDSQEYVFPPKLTHHSGFKFLKKIGALFVFVWGPDVKILATAKKGLLFSVKNREQLFIQLVLNNMINTYLSVMHFHRHKIKYNYHMYKEKGEIQN